jgi:signal transduction histidine kinase
MNKCEKGFKALIAGCRVHPKLVADTWIRDNPVGAISRRWLFSGNVILSSRGFGMWKKIATPMLIVCLFWLVVSFTTTFYILWSRQARARNLTENVASIQAAGLLQESLWKLQATFSHAMLNSESGDQREIPELELKFESSLDLARHAAVVPAERELVGTIGERFSEYRELIDRSRMNRTGGPATAGAVVERSAEIARRVAKPCTDLLEFNERLLADSGKQTAQVEETLVLARLLFFVTGPAVGIYVGLRIARNLHHSISQIRVTLNDASGELDQEVGCVEIAPAGNPDDLSRLNQEVQAISTRIRQVVSELSRARHEAVVAERLAVVGELAAGIAHELRNPLTSVKLLVQTAPRAESGIALQDRHAQIVLQEIGRMEETIQGLLDFARPSELHRVRHDVRETLRRGLNLVEGRAVHDGITIVERLADAPLVVDADPGQLIQVFVNLFINGIEAMHRGDVLDVAAAVSDQNSRTCLVTVADRGNGIPQELLGKVFEPFVTTKERGIGLGLAVSRRIIREHGGKVVAGNRPEGGAVFVVELPLVEIPASASPDPAAHDRSPGGSLLNMSRAV